MLRSLSQYSDDVYYYQKLPLVNIQTVIFKHRLRGRKTVWWVHPSSSIREKTHLIQETEKESFGAMLLFKWKGKNYTVPGNSKYDSILQHSIFKKPVSNALEWTVSTSYTGHCPTVSMKP